MSRASSQARGVAAQLIAYETKENNSPKSDLPSAFHVCEKLRPHLATLMGKAGFRAVLSRAVAVAGAEVPWLSAVEVNADGALVGWEKPEAQVASKKLADSGVILVAQLLGLLVAFIGPSLTLRLVRDIWPKLSLEDAKFIQGEP